MALLPPIGCRQVQTAAKGRPASPREIAEVFLFVATDRASFITRRELFVDAGRTAV